MSKHLVESRGTRRRVTLRVSLNAPQSCVLSLNASVSRNEAVFSCCHFIPIFLLGCCCYRLSEKYLKIARKYTGASFENDKAADRKSINIV